MEWLTVVLSVTGVQSGSGNLIAEALRNGGLAVILGAIGGATISAIAQWGAARVNRKVTLQAQAFERDERRESWQREQRLEAYISAIRTENALESTGIVLVNAVRDAYHSAPSGQLTPRSDDVVLVERLWADHVVALERADEPWTELFVFGTPDIAGAMMACIDAHHRSLPAPDVGDTFEEWAASVELWRENRDDRLRARHRLRDIARAELGIDPWEEKA